MPEAFAQRRCFNPRSPTPNSEGFRCRDDFNADLTYCFFGMRFYYLLLYWLLIFSCYSWLLTIVSSSCTFKYYNAQHARLSLMGGCCCNFQSSALMSASLRWGDVTTVEVHLPWCCLKSVKYLYSRLKCWCQHSLFLILLRAKLNCVPRIFIYLEFL